MENLIVWIGVVCLAVVIVFQILLTLGFPLGEFSMGGKYKVFPFRMRIVSTISAVLLLGAILVLLHLGGVVYIEYLSGWAKPVGYTIGGYLCFNTLMNIFSNSKKERFTMSPLSAITAFCFFYVI